MINSSPTSSAGFIIFNISDYRGALFVSLEVSACKAGCCSAEAVTKAAKAALQPHVIFCLDVTISATESNRSTEMFQPRKLVFLYGL